MGGERVCPDLRDDQRVYNEPSSPLCHIVSVMTPQGCGTSYCGVNIFKSITQTSRGEERPPARQSDPPSPSSDLLIFKLWVGCDWSVRVNHSERRDRHGQPALAHPPHYQHQETQHQSTAEKEAAAGGTRSWLSGQVTANPGGLAEYPGKKLSFLEKIKFLQFFLHVVPI